MEEEGGNVELVGSEKTKANEERRETKNLYRQTYHHSPITDTDRAIAIVHIHETKEVSSLVTVGADNRKKDKDKLAQKSDQNVKTVLK